MTVIADTDPYIRPGRRYHEAFDALQFIFVGNLFVAVNIYECLALFLAVDAGLVVVDIH